MSRVIQVLLLLSLLCLAACSRDADSPPADDVVEGEVTESGESWREDRLMLGRRTYETACASCHDSGKLDAPLTGNPKDWVGRSDLWEAVLMEHAKTGYLEMPEKGGNPDLSEDSVEAAAEYMLGITFPDRLTD